jgi:hypothetical protein
MDEQKYAKWTVEGDKKTKWNCGCCQTSDNYFKFCSTHNKILQKAIQDKIDDLDMTLVIEEEKEK